MTRRESLHDLVADVMALIREPLQKRNRRGEVLVQYDACSLSVRFLAKSQKHIAREVVPENQDALMTRARFSNVQKVEVQQLGHALSVYLLAERARSIGPLGDRVQKRQL